MTLGVRVTGFDGQTETEDDGFSRIEFVRVPLESRERANARFELGDDGRLLEKVISTCVDAADAILTRRQCGDEHDRNESSLRGAFETTAHFNAVDAWHVDVEEHEVRTIARDRLERQLAI